jgi:hypothetical protein
MTMRAISRPAWCARADDQKRLFAGGHHRQGRGHGRLFGDNGTESGRTDEVGASPRGRVTAWLEVRGRAWWSEREIAEEEGWRYDINYQAVAVRCA